MATWIVAIVCLLIGSFVGAGIMAIVASGSDKRGQEGEDFLSEPVELERRSISRWSMRIVK